MAVPILILHLALHHLRRIRDFFEQVVPIQNAQVKRDLMEWTVDVSVGQVQKSPGCGRHAANALAGMNNQNGDLEALQQTGQIAA